MHQRIVIAGSCSALLIAVLSAQPFRPEIPKAWDDREVASFEVPLAQPDRSPRYLSAAEYYAKPERTIYRGYPMYAMDNEPPGYFESLAAKEPEILFEPAKLRSEEDWIHAGEIVFTAPVAFGSRETQTLIRPEFLRDVPLRSTPDGVIPYMQWVVRTKGVVEFGFQACAFCHSRVLPDGTVWRGAQGDFPGEQRNAWAARRGEVDDRRTLANESWLFAAPWVNSPEELVATTPAEAARRRATMQPGVFSRIGSSSAAPVHIPSLVGIKDRKYLDATGLTRHRSIADVMRYAIVNAGERQGLQGIAKFGDFQPATTLPTNERYSDEQLYALARYLYSLEPPPNPNPFDETARRGQSVFQQAGCATCHTPPLYTNNKLTPAVGFQVTDAMRKADDILDISVGTDPTLAMRTRRGTGFYKVPSLRGVWYRNAFGHSGQAETLDEWFDPARFADDYVPKGFHLGPGPIRGHRFGTNLPVEDRRALIAFLKTL